MTDNTRNIFVLTYDDVSIRSSLHEDIESYVRWYTTETDWLLWDSPWKTHEADPLEIRERLARIISRPQPEIWTRLQICTQDGSHIGSVTSNYEELENETQKFIGIFIAKQEHWGQGFGEKAFKLWVAYLLTVKPDQELYCGTWSGNTRMIKLAEKGSFCEFERIHNWYHADGIDYDRVKLQLDRDKFRNDNSDLMNVVAEQIHLAPH